MQHSVNKNQFGVTIIESLVVVLVLSLALIPILSAITGSLDISSNIKNSFIASNLAQEGVEVVRAIRDKNWYDADPLPSPPPNPPYPFMNPPSGNMAGVWRVQWDSDTLIPVGTNPYLKKDSNGVYGYNAGGSETMFKRTITINGLNPDGDADLEEMRIVSEVTWVTKHGVNKSVRAESHLYNWR